MKKQRKLAFLNKLFTRKKKVKKGKFNTIGKIVKVTENIGDFKRADPAVNAGISLKQDIEEKEVIDKALGIQGYVQTSTNRPTTMIPNIDDEKELESPEKPQQEELKSNKQDKQPYEGEKVKSKEEDQIEIEEEDVIEGHEENSDYYDIVKKEEVETIQVAVNDKPEEDKESSPKNENSDNPKESIEESQESSVHEEERNSLESDDEEFKSARDDGDKVQVAEAKLDDN